MKEEGGGLGTMLGLNPGLRDGAGHPFPGLIPGFRGIPGVLGPHGTNGNHLNGPHPPPATPPLPNMWPFIFNHISNLLPQLSIARMDPLSQVFSLRWNHHGTITKQICSMSLTSCSSLRHSVMLHLLVMEVR